MRLFILTFACLLSAVSMASAQGTPPAAPAVPAADTDTTIYDFADAMPFPMIGTCLRNKPADWPIDSFRRCGETQLLTLLARNIRYPDAARDSNIQGTVVVQFVVEKTGRMTQYRILRDIGGGCGPEALRILAALDEAGLRWQPAVQAKNLVRARTTLPLRFKLEEALPWYLNETRDTIHTVYEKDAAFKTGIDSLVHFILNQLDYPEEHLKTCKTGVMEMSVLIRKNGSVQVENQIDFSNLGMDYQWEALRLVNKTANLWAPAQYQGQPVNALLPLRVVFKSDDASCKTANEQFDQMMLLADEGARLLEQDKSEEAIAKWTEALKTDPNNTEILYYRGTALLNMGKREDACKDYNRVKEILGLTWFEGVRKVVCGW